MLEPGEAALSGAEKIVDLTWEFITASRAMILATWISLTVVGFLTDMQDLNNGDVTGGFSSAVSIIQVVLYYYMLVSIIRKNELTEGPIKAGAVYFGISILSGIGILIGLVLLILPGIFLFIRWAPAYGYAFIQGKGVIDSLGQSMDDTGEHWAPILMAMVVPTVLLVLGTLGFSLASFEEVLPIEASWLLANALIFAGSMFYTVMGLAIYCLINRRNEALTEVFE